VPVNAVVWRAKELVETGGYAHNQAHAGRCRCCLHRFFHVRNSFCLSPNLGVRGNQRQAESQTENGLVIRSSVTIVKQRLAAVFYRTRVAGGALLQNSALDTASLRRFERGSH
jgi:hypothetical protein